MSNLFKSVADIFRPVQQVAVTNATMSQQNPGANPDQQQQQQQQPPNPLDAMKALVQTDPNAKPPVDPLAAPILNSDPAKIREAAGKLDFTQAIPQDIMQRAMAGNDPQAFIEAMNAVGRQAVAISTQLATSTVDAGARTASQRVLESLPEHLKTIQLREAVPENPILQHEAAQPLLGFARQVVRSKNPTMPAAEINKQAEGYLMALVEASKQADASKQQQQIAQTTGHAEDWSRFLN